MESTEWVVEIKNQIGPYFVSSHRTELSERIMALSPLDKRSSVCLVHRDGGNSDCFRTILIASATTEDDIGKILHWAASVRDLLEEPRAADLYLFLETFPSSIITANRLESDDQYCRKYVRRNSESPKDFLSRTFLAVPSHTGDFATLSDPISTSIDKAATIHTLFSEPNPEFWRRILLADESSQDLAERIGSHERDNIDYE